MADPDQIEHVFYVAPSPDHPEFVQQHQAEAERQGAEFYNFGASSGDDWIGSKTSKGWLHTDIDRDTGKVSHHWEPFHFKNFEIKLAVLIDTGQRCEVGVPRMLDALRAIIDKLERGQPIIEEERWVEYQFEGSR
jgi:hypothetical protein